MIWSSRSVGIVPAPFRPGPVSYWYQIEYSIILQPLHYVEVW
uniref:Uncharacterized protein n=1 Tax=Myoviridae sp. ct9Fw19 TaxID=2826624 RepID=A0A8S5MBK4_9CAUD|nr:MAG TPA: hypothetical protein [Myoviridae sp. ct9Fw19]